MQDAVQDFKYTKAMREIEKYAKNAYALPEKSEFFGRCLLDIDEFMALYFSGDFTNYDDNPASSFLLPEPQSTETDEMSFPSKREGYTTTFNHYRNVMSDDKRQHLRQNKKTRSKRDYALTEEEISTAKKYLEENPSVQQAFAALQGCLSAYFEGLYKRCENFYPLGVRPKNGYAWPEWDNHLWSFDIEAKGMSFIHDLLPVVALGLSRNEEDLTPYQFGKALCDAFRLQAFKSFDDRDGYVKKERHCPFGAHITRLLSKGLARSEDDGTVVVLQDQKPGTLLYSLISLFQHAPYREQEPLQV